MFITSYFENGEEIPKKFTADGKNINPPINISELPEKTKSLVLIMDDPDAVKITGEIFYHWILYDIHPTSQIPENSVPRGSKQGKNSFGSLGYSGPSPPEGSGIHTYRFILYALSEKIDLPEGAKIDEVKKMMDGNVIETSEILGTYTRDE